MNLRTLSTVALASLALVAAGCGDDDEDEGSASDGAAATATVEPTPAPEPAPAPTAEAPESQDTGLQVSEDTAEKPEIPTPEGDPPAELVVEDVVEGEGPAAQPGDQLTMQYVGISHSSGEQFDASWDRGESFPFQLGAQMVIAGWDQGMVGMKAGGRRILVIPPDLAYADQPPPGSGIEPGETLVFVVDLEQLN